MWQDSHTQNFQKSDDRVSLSRLYFQGWYLVGYIFLLDYVFFLELGKTIFLFLMYAYVKSPSVIKLLAFVIVITMLSILSLLLFSDDSRLKDLPLFTLLSSFETTHFHRILQIPSFSSVLIYFSCLNKIIFVFFI